MNQRRLAWIAAIGATTLAGCLALSLWAGTRIRDAGESKGVSWLLMEPGRDTARGSARPGGTPPLVPVAAPLTACEARIKHQAHRRPTMAIVGASYTAGVGPDSLERSWAVELARQLRWNAVIYGVSGAGYARASASGRGPMTRMLAAIGLRELGPALVIVQAGHDDLGLSAATVRHQVGSTVRFIRAAVPGARIGLLTTFAVSADGSSALQQVDQAIITAGAAAASGVIIMDPLADRWAYPRAADGLHPTAAGDVWIARRVAAILSAHAVRPAPSAATAPVICDIAVGVAQPAETTALPGSGSAGRS